MHADVLTAAATYTCRSGAPVASSSGEVAGLTVNGQSMTIPQGTNQTIPLGSLGTLVLNQVDTSEAGRITRRAVLLTTPLGTVVISEATADISGNPCAVTPARPAPPRAPRPAPRPPARPRAPALGPPRLIVLPPAVGRLIALHACVRGRFIARVIGHEIRTVTFSLDGGHRATVRGAPFQTSVQASPGRHLLLARVSFLKATHAPARTLRLRFTGCSPVPPAFTG